MRLLVLLFGKLMCSSLLNHVSLASAHPSFLNPWRSGNEAKTSSSNTLYSPLLNEEEEYASIHPEENLSTIGDLPEDGLDAEEYSALVNLKTNWKDNRKTMQKMANLRLKQLKRAEDIARNGGSGVILTQDNTYQKIIRDLLKYHDQVSAIKEGAYDADVTLYRASRQSRHLNTALKMARQYKLDTLACLHWTDYEDALQPHNFHARNINTYRSKGYQPQRFDPIEIISWQQQEANELLARNHKR